MTRPKRILAMNKIADIIQKYDYTPGIPVVSLDRDELGAISIEIIDTVILTKEDDVYYGKPRKK